VSESAEAARGLDTDAAPELLAILNAAERLDQISPLKSVGLHPLKGDRRDQWAITVNLMLRNKRGAGLQ
jgi:proteic killer suppression protein